MPAPPRRGNTCGCAAASVFLVLVGLPVLMVFGFGNAPCADGPCNPNGARNLEIAAWVIAGTTLALWLGIRLLVNRWDRTHGGRLPWWIFAGAAVLLLAGATMFKFVMG